MRVRCLHCDAENDAIQTAGYCDACGSKLPPAAMVRTREPLTGRATDTAASAPAARRRAAEALALAAVVGLIGGGLFLILGPALFSRVSDRFLPTVLLWTLLPSAALGGLAAAARWWPRPALFAALAGYAGWVALGFVLDPTFARGWLLVHAALVGVLGWATFTATRRE